MCTHSRRRQMRTAFLLFAVICFFFRGAAGASEGPPPTLNPKSYASPSGRYSMFVNPSDLYGRGKATYRLTLEGRQVWSGEKPYTLWDACVGDDGVVAGYAYSHGWRGFSEAGHEAGMGEFRVVIIDAQGKERLEHVTKRADSRFLHRPPDPLASGVILDSEHDRLIVRVHDADVNQQAESWWCYRLSTGVELGRFRPKELMADSGPVRSLMDAKAVRGTPLYVLHWWRYDWQREQKQGARFSVIGENGKPVWTQDLPADYETGRGDEADERLSASVRRTGGVLRSDENGRFDLRFAKDGQRVTFAAALGADGNWTVSEVARRPFVEMKSSPESAAIPLLALRPAGRIVLESPAAAPVPELRDVREFVFDPGGHIAFLRWSEKRSLAVVVVDQKGKVLHTCALDLSHAQDRVGWSDLTCVGAGRYLLLRDNPSDRNQQQAAVLDVATGKTTPIAGFTTTNGSKFAGFADGGFAVLGGIRSFRGGGTPDQSLRTFNERGERLGAVPGNGDANDPAALFSPAALTVTTDGLVAVVDVIRKSVQFFERRGKHHHTVDLKKAWGREPHYPSDIMADRDGGVVVHDFGGDLPFVRMNADGTIRAQVRPRLKNGVAIDLRDTQVAPDGVLWVSDGHALYRLLESGVAGSVLGEAPDPQRMDAAAAVTLDSRGNIYAVVGRTGAVHVFGPDGRWLRVCLPEQGEVSRALMLPDLTVSDSGDVYLGLGTFGHKYLHFAADGKRIGIETCKLDEISERWYAQPGTDRRWVTGYEKVYLIDSKGTVIRTIARRADGVWLDHPGRASVAADGSIALVSGSKRARLNGGGLAVSLYSPQGDPIRTFNLPESVKWHFPDVAYDGKRVVLTGEKAIVIFDTLGKAIGRFTPLEDEDAAWTPLFGSDSRGLLLFDGKKTLYRFELPQ
jgi:hypothetical protein